MSFGRASMIGYAINDKMSLNDKQVDNSLIPAQLMTCHLYQTANIKEEKNNP